MSGEGKDSKLFTTDELDTISVVVGLVGNEDVAGALRFEVASRTNLTAMDQFNKLRDQLLTTCGHDAAGMVGHPAGVVNASVSFGLCAAMLKQLNLLPFDVEELVDKINREFIGTVVQRAGVGLS